MQPRVGLSIDKTATEVSFGRVVYELTVTNAGPSDWVETLEVTDPLPTGLTYESAVGPGWDCGVTDRTIRCSTDATLEAGASSTITVAAAITATPGTEVHNTAYVQGGAASTGDEDSEVVVAPADPQPDEDTTDEMAHTGGPFDIWLLIGVFLIAIGATLFGLGRRARLD